MVAPILFALALSLGPQGTLHEVLAEIRIQGNVLTPDSEVQQLAGLEVGMAIAQDTPTHVAARLQETHRFKRVEVLKRFASIADPSQIVLVVIVDEGPVTIDQSAGPGTTRVVQTRLPRCFCLC